MILSGEVYIAVFVKHALPSLLCSLIPRYDSHSGGEREIQRTMLELLNQLDGFDSRGDVKVGPSMVLHVHSVSVVECCVMRLGNLCC